MKFRDLLVQNLNQAMKVPYFNHSDFQLALDFTMHFLVMSFGEVQKKVLRFNLVISNFRFERRLWIYFGGFFHLIDDDSHSLTIFRIASTEFRIVLTKFRNSESSDQLVHRFRSQGESNLFEGRREEQVITDCQVAVDVVNWNNKSITVLKIPPT